jgi:hypothetical protein
VDLGIVVAMEVTAETERVVTNPVKLATRLAVLVA